VTSAATSRVGRPPSGATFVYVSNADEGDISMYVLDASGGIEQRPRINVAKGVMPMAVSPDRRFLCAVSRSPPCAIHLYAIDRGTGALTLSSTSSLAESLPYISFDNSGRFVLGASYAASLVTVMGVGADRRVDTAPLQVIPVGRNAHSIRVDRTNRFAYVATLGSDAVFMFKFDASTGSLASNTPALCLTRAGSGPRHFVISSDNRFLYVLCEMTADILTFALDGETGLLTEVSSVSGLLPGSPLVPGVPRGGPTTRDLERDIWAADIHLTPDGEFLYISERTGSTLNAFQVDRATGKLTYLSTHATERQPRGFAIDPSGRYLVATGEKSDTISLYGINFASGALEGRRQYPTGKGANWVEIVSFDGAASDVAGP